MNVADIKHANFCPTPSWFTPTKHRGRRRLGVKYEKFVQSFLTSTYDSAHTANPWITYQLHGDWRTHFAQPDSLIRRDDGSITIVEIKHNHTPDAFFQLFNLYEPLINFILPANPTTCIEVCKWYDPSVVCPSPPALCPSIEDAKRSSFNVMIYNP